MNEGNPEIILDADELVPQVDPADLPIAPPAGITEQDAIDQDAIDKAANHVYLATLGAIGTGSDNEDVQQALKQMMVDTLVSLDLEGNPEWAVLSYREKAVDAALRIRLGLIELMLARSLLLDHLRRLRGPGLSLN